VSADRGWIGCVAAAVAGGMMLAGGASCRTALRGEPVAAPLEFTDPQLLLGQQVFMRDCNQCHPGGAAGLAPAINDKPLPGGLIKFQVRNGLGAMPAFDEEEIADEELEAIVAYLEAIREQEVP
jgi:mono/diheme cytochrome c family protein